MTSTFAEAWDLLLSDGTSSKGVNMSTPRPAAPGKAPVSKSQAHNKSNNTQKVESGSRPGSRATSSRVESGEEVTDLLQSLRRDVNALQYSGHSRTAQDTSAIAMLNRKIERLTDAATSNSSSASSPSKDGKSDSGPNTPSSSSSSSKDADGDLSCWEPCCNGRKFSNKSNMIRHRREQSGEMGKLRCSFCNASFSRSSARNAHEAKRICRTNNRRY